MFVFVYVQGVEQEEDDDNTASEEEEEEEDAHLPEGPLGHKRKERGEQDKEEEDDNKVSNTEEQSGSQSEDCTEDGDWQSCSEEEEEEEEDKGDGASTQRVEDRQPQSNLNFRNSSRLLRKDELLSMFKSAHAGPTCREGHITVGLVSANLCPC